MTAEHSNEPLPEWAWSTIEDTKQPDLFVGQQLCTMDGRIVGNARIESIHISPYTGEYLYHVRTDAGNLSKYSYREVLERYYLGNFITKGKSTYKT